MSPLFSVVFDLDIYILAGNKDMHESMKELKFQPDQAAGQWLYKRLPLSIYTGSYMIDHFTSG